MQELIVAVIVLVALVYAIWTFTPASWRRPLLVRLGLGRHAARAGDCHDSAACKTCRACGTPPSSGAHPGKP